MEQRVLGEQVRGHAPRNGVVGAYQVAVGIERRIDRRAHPVVQPVRRPIGAFGTVGAEIGVVAPCGRKIAPQTDERVVTVHFVSRVGIFQLVAGNDGQDRKASKARQGTVDSEGVGWIGGRHAGEILPVAAIVVCRSPIPVELVIDVGAATADIEVPIRKRGDRKQLALGDEGQNRRLPGVPIECSFVVPEGIGICRIAAGWIPAVNRHIGKQGDSIPLNTGKVRVGGIRLRETGLISDPAERRYDKPVNRSETQRFAGLGIGIVDHPVSVLIGEPRPPGASGPGPVGRRHFLPLLVAGGHADRPVRLHPAPSEVAAEDLTAAFLRREPLEVDLQPVEPLHGDGVDDARDGVRAIDGRCAVLENFVAGD